MLVARVAGTVLMHALGVPPKTIASRMGLADTQVLAAILVAGIAPIAGLAVFAGLPVLCFLSITTLRGRRRGRAEYSDFT